MHACTPWLTVSRAHVPPLLTDSRARTHPHYNYSHIYSLIHAYMHPQSAWESIKSVYALLFDRCHWFLAFVAFYSNVYSRGLDCEECWGYIVINADLRNAMIGLWGRLGLCCDKSWFEECWGHVMINAGLRNAMIGLWGMLGLCCDKSWFEECWGWVGRNAGSYFGLNRIILMLIFSK
jgi:hypothetical protein